MIRHKQYESVRTVYKGIVSAAWQVQCNKTHAQNYMTHGCKVMTWQFNIHTSDSLILMHSYLCVVNCGEPRFPNSAAVLHCTFQCFPHRTSILTSWILTLNLYLVYWNTQKLWNALKPYRLKVPLKHGQLKSTGIWGEFVITGLHFAFYYKGSFSMCHLELYRFTWQDTLPVWFSNACGLFNSWQISYEYRQNEKNK